MKIEDLQKKFPHHTIRSLPDQGCTCNNGVRTSKAGFEHPCLCVCLSSEREGAKEDRAELVRDFAAVVRRIFKEQEGGE